MYNMKKFIFLILLSAFLFPQCHSAQTVEAEIFYLKREPKIKIENPPLLILLHGLGSNENDLYGLVNHLPDSFLILSLRATRTIKDGSYRWYDLQWVNGEPVGNKAEQVESRDILIRFLENLHKKHKFDKKRLYLGGFSQGAVMSLAVALKSPELLKGIFLLSGKIPEAADLLSSNKAYYDRLKIFMVHGIEDKVLSIEGARFLKSFLETNRFKVEYHEFNMPHTINRETLIALNLWLQIQ
jgi:phospholipase/carboxylesterase